VEPGGAPWANPQGAFERATPVTQIRRAAGVITWRAALRRVIGALQIPFFFFLMP
jgi:hypothetical protein